MLETVATGGEIWLSEVLLTDVYKGDLSPGTVIRVARYVPKSGFQPGYQPALTEPAYLLGLNPSEYGDDVWGSISGPHAMLAFDGIDNNAKPVRILKPANSEEMTSLEATLSATSLGEVKALFLDAAAAITTD